MKVQHTDYWINKLSLCQFLEQTLKITKTADEFPFSGWWWCWWLLQELFAGNRQYVNEMVEEHDIWIQQQSFLPLTTDACSQSSSSRTVSVISLDSCQLTCCVLDKIQCCCCLLTLFTPLQCALCVFNVTAPYCWHKCYKDGLKQNLNTCEIPPTELNNATTAWGSAWSCCHNSIDDLETTGVGAIHRSDKLARQTATIHSTRQWACDRCDLWSCLRFPDRFLRS